jgi:4-amino-4-deoxy-L-arabinose transferase-like glycosyltransferase
LARRLAPLVPLLLLAAALRFTGLSWGLRHRPQLDERFYVANVGHMLSRGDLDHGFYQYPGFFYYLLAPVLAFFDDPRLDPRAFLAARAVVASFGVASVGLVYVLGQRISGTPAAITAAALLAVSPVEVRVSHEVRPDVVRETFVLLGMLAFLGGLRAGWDAVAGVALGAATAPARGARALLRPLVRSRLSPIPALPAGIVSLVTWAALSPYTFLRGAASLEGMDKQLSYHYVERAADQGFLGTALAYGRIAVDGLGLPGCLLAVAGIALGRRQWRDWLPFLVFPLVTVAAFSTATIHQDRFLVPALGVLALSTAPAVQALYAWRPLVLALTAVLAVVGPARESVGYVRDVSRPATRDVTADWIEQNVASGRVVATLNAAVGLDPKRFDAARERPEPRTRIQAIDADLVVTGPGADCRVLQS